MLSNRISRAIDEMSDCISNKSATDAGQLADLCNSNATPAPRLGQSMFNSVAWWPYKHLGLDSPCSTV